MATHNRSDSAHASDDGSSGNSFDVLIIGAGISGINSAYRVQNNLPSATYAVLEGRANLGGTWDLFKYPGIRSDSDLYTFGFPFNPWYKDNPIATGDSIVQYMTATTKKFGIDKHLKFQHKVRSADWSTAEQRWVLDVETEAGSKTMYARFLILGTGYYNYDKPLDADIPGLENFQGKRIHPQFWPSDFDYSNKKIVVIGSGATAITLVPALAEKAAKVTMLQRSPSYILSLPQRKPGDPPSWSEWLLPRSILLKFRRWFFLVQPYLFYLFCRKYPEKASKFVIGGARKQLPKDMAIDPHFTPRYNVWDQRLCLCPNGDFFKAFKRGNTDVVTSTIKTVTADGIELANGDKLSADVIVTATGLNLQFCGQIALSVDKKPINIPQHFLWRNTMISSVPNLFTVIGYVNAPWTLGADSCARLVTRLIAHMDKKGYTSATPEISAEAAAQPTQALALKSTYIQRGLDHMPKTATVGPWKPRENYFKDNWTANWGKLEEGLVLTNAKSA